LEEDAPEMTMHKPDDRNLPFVTFVIYAYCFKVQNYWTGNKEYKSCIIYSPLAVSYFLADFTVNKNL
jgi:hypothetical protein